MSAPESTERVRGSADAGSFPRRFGQYVLVTRLGRGGMGEVYLAWSGGLAEVAKLCVVKTMRADIEDIEGAAGRFLDEARVAIALTHPHICMVYDVGVADGVSYIAMEYAGRRNLADVQRETANLGAGFPEDVAIWLVSRLLDGLQYAHHACHPMSGEPLHVVHRDVSPQNVMVRHDGTVKLIDFGLATSTTKTQRTRTGLVGGKLTYIAPEQVRSEPVDARADQFAVGVMLYELVSGQPFYGELKEHEIWRIGAAGGFRPEGWDVLSSELRAVLDRALAAQRNDRFPSCEAFADALSTVLTIPPSGSAKRFKQLMTEVFPDGEQEERKFLSSLPDPLSASASKSEPPSAPPAPPATPAPPVAESSPAPLPSSTEPSPRRPVGIAAGLLAGAAMLVAVMAIFVFPSSPETSGGAREAARPDETGDKEPPAEPVRAVEEVLEPVIDEPTLAATEPPPAPSAPPASPEPAAQEKPATERAPKRPKAEAAAAATEPKAATTEIERMRTSLASCSDPCAPVWSRHLAGLEEIPQDVGKAVKFCLERCEKEVR